MRPFGLPALLVLAACFPRDRDSADPKQDSGEDTAVGYVDEDGDGFTTENDCNDTDTEINPAKLEHCDGVDEDCDGKVDDNVEDMPAWYADADHDTYGDSSSSTTACTAPDGYVADATDCDDADASVSPAGVEVCDTADQDEDCDGTADDADSEAGGKSEFYRDQDGDGYGDENASPTPYCDAPFGYVADHTDCDDGDLDRNPTGQRCTTELKTSDASSVITASNPGGFFGYGLDAADWSGDGVPDYAVSAYYESGGKGSGYVFFGPLGASETTAAADLTLSDSTSSFVSWWIGSVGDINGDGAADLGVVTWDAFAILEGPLSAGDSLSSAAISLTPDAGDGPMTVAVGDFDFNGDGQSDLAIGNSNWNSPHYQGAVYVEYGPSVSSGSIESAPVILRGEAEEDNTTAGSALANAGDMDGDGLDDLAVGATYNDDAGDYAGAAFVVSGGTTGTVSLSDAAAVVTGTGKEQYVGEGVAGNGDVDGDGYGDLLIAAQRYGTSYAGNVWLMAGPLSSGTVASAAASFPGIAAYDEHGYTLAPLRDLDGDGLADVVTGSLSEYTCASGKGLVSLFYGPVSGTLSCEFPDVSIFGNAANGRFGKGLASPGDLDGDGLGDLLVGAYMEGNGKAYVFDGADF